MGDRFYKEAYRSFKDHEEAEDAVSIAIFKLWHKADKYKPEKPALPYALSVLRNHCRDEWRRRARKPKPMSLYDYMDPEKIPSQQ